MRNIWKRRPDESDEWYRRFETYLAMGESRSVLGVYRAEGNPEARSVPGSWKDTVKRHEWQKRAAAWDLRIEDLAEQIEKPETPQPDRASDEARSGYLDREPRLTPHQMRRIQRQIDWEHEREALRERQLTMASMLYDKAVDMLSCSLDGDDAASWSLRDAEAFIKTSSALTEAAIKMGEEQASRKQLAGWHYLAQQLLTMDDSADLSQVKQLLAAFLDASLLDLGKPARGELKRTIEAAGKVL